MCWLSVCQIVEETIEVAKFASLHFSTKTRMKRLPVSLRASRTYSTANRCGMLDALVSQIVEETVGVVKNVPDR